MNNHSIAPSISYGDVPTSFDTATSDSQDYYSIPAGSPSSFHHGSVHTRDSSASSAHGILQQSEQYDHFGYGSRDTPSPFGSTGGLSRSGTILSPTHSRCSTGSQISFSPNTTDYFNGYNYHLADKTAPRSTTSSQIEPMAGSDSFRLNASIDLTSTKSMLMDTEIFGPTLCSRRDDDHDSTLKKCSSTCVSSQERSNRSRALPKFWCTACERGFVNKSDWKSHEERSQERFDIYTCDKCNKFFFVKSKYTSHHNNEHGCSDCKSRGDAHANAAKKTRDGRKAWGCGFCCRFDTVWKMRCDHIAFQHFNPSDPSLRKTNRDWDHSQVIRSLLSRTGIAEAWKNVLDGADDTVLKWDQRTTGRAEGYPDSKCEPQLQDLLEWYPDGAVLSDVVNRALRESSAAPRHETTVTRQDHWNMQVMDHSSMSSINSRMIQIPYQYYLHELAPGGYTNFSRPLPTQPPQYVERFSTTRLYPPVLSRNGFNTQHVKESRLPLSWTAPWTQIENTIIDDLDRRSPANAVAYYDTTYDAEDHTQFTPE
ncbi:hypothetical protein BDV96DRAFT_406038 [Lophiotrema nucula]|uniref:C2H2-type domain-containing protein n=1 Tax=Lophiotrema nucula TaxID=690887 RepID=A0A6A5ZHL6_9PLEO|nr:hypothetical protein BDV96DRAFT_406038 [Lophiotrema nucula]